MHNDTDPTPAHGTPRPTHAHTHSSHPTKTHVLDRQIASLRAQRTVLVAEISIALAENDANLARLDQLNDDIATLEQLVIDMFPEPRD